MAILLIFFASVALVAVITVTSMRFFFRRAGRQQLYENGVVMSASGIEYWGLLFTGVRKKTFSEIRSVELLPYYEVLMSILLLRYGLSARRVPFNPFGKIVVIRLKHPNPIEYLFFTPKDASVFVERLQQLIKEAQAPSAQISHASPTS